MDALPTTLAALATAHLWQATLILALLAPAALLLRRAPARYEHRLWLVGLAALALPLEQSAGLLTGLFPADAVPAALEPVSAALTAPLLVSAEAAASPLHLFAATVWLAVALSLGARLVLAVRAGRALLHESRPAGADLSAAAADIPADRLRIHDRAAAPHVVGWLRPLIVLPAGLARDLSPAELRSVLRHEDAHRRRRDPLRMLAARAVAAVFWFYPPTWLLLRRLETTAEYACDEAAAPRRRDGVVLAAAVARTVRRALAAEDPSFHPVASLAGGRASLGRRINRMIHERRYRAMTRYRLILAIAVLAAAGGTLLAAPAHLPEPASEPEAPAPAAAPEPAVTPAAPEDLAVPEPAAVPDAEADKPDPADPPEKRAKKVQGVVLRPTFTKYVEPKYPEELREAGVEAVVMLVVKVDEKGVPVDIAWKSKGEIDKRFVKAAVAAMEKCRFEPRKKEGVPVAWDYKIPVKFKLD
jgi:TonB family protein